MKSPPLIAPAVVAGVVLRVSARTFWPCVDPLLEPLPERREQGAGVGSVSGYEISTPIGRVRGPGHRPDG
jgi:hypothetical protein